jgi:hypothetical protein
VPAAAAAVICVLVVVALLNQEFGGFLSLVCDPSMYSLSSQKKNVQPSSDGNLCAEVNFLLFRLSVVNKSFLGNETVVFFAGGNETVVN